MRSRSFKARNPNGQHRLHFTEWGTDGAPVVLCLHGLTQTARSFDALAASLSARFQVISLDIVGRGESDWLPDPRAMGFRNMSLMFTRCSPIWRLRMSILSAPRWGE